MIFREWRTLRKCTENEQFLTDILGAVQLGFHSVLVLSGGTKLEDLPRYAYRPEVVVANRWRNARTGWIATIGGYRGGTRRNAWPWRCEHSTWVMSFSEVELRDKERTMTIPVWVEQTNGKFTASVLGSPQLRACAETNDAAIAELRIVLSKHLASRNLVVLDLEPFGLLSLGSKFKDDPEWQRMWDEIAAEAYRYRDELKAQEFPE